MSDTFKPLTPPEVRPSDAPLRTIEVNEEWIALLVGLIDREFSQRRMWDCPDDFYAEFLQYWVDELIALVQEGV